MFQLQRIKIQKHPIFGSADLTFNRTTKYGDFQDGNMTSVIIGRNGIGKSYLLRAIAEIFKTLDSLINGHTDVDMPELTYRFEVQYTLDEHEYKVSDINYGLEPFKRKITHRFIFEVDGHNAKRNAIMLPQAVIASSMTIADKFPTPSMGIYKYRGVRSEKTPSTTGTRTIVRKAVEGIMDSLAHKHDTRNEIAMILLELGFQPHLEIRYRFRYKDVFLKPNMNPELLNEIYTEWPKYFKGRSGEVWGTKYYNTLKNNPNQIKTICDFLRQCAQSIEHNRDYQLTYDVFDDNNTIIADSDALKLLSNLDILSFPEFKVFKKNDYEGYDFTNSSSGETQQMCQFISIMSAIESNSLILIDEPENSSHPNWQMKYIGWLQQIFSTYRDCHFLIATHSHFLLTDMKPEWSNIIALDKTENGLTNIAEVMNTFCWSTDDILYRVFHVRNTRNYVFENKMCELYKYIENAEVKTKKAQELLNELKGYTLNDDDPLHKLLKLAEHA